MIYKIIKSVTQTCSDAQRHTYTHFQKLHTYSHNTHTHTHTHTRSTEGKKFYKQLLFNISALNGKLIHKMMIKHCIKIKSLFD